MENELALARLRDGNGSIPNFNDNPRTPDISKLLPKFEDGQDLEIFLKSFERVMEMHNIEQNVWVSKLTPILSPKCLCVFSTLELDVCKDYTKLKEALLLKFQISAEASRQQFRNFRKSNEQTYTETATELHRLAISWFQKAKALENVQTLTECVLMEQFQNQIVLDSRITNHLLSKNLKNLHDMATECDIYVQNHKFLRTENLGMKTKC